MGIFERSEFELPNQPSGSANTTWYSMKIAPTGSASRVALA